MWKYVSRRIKDTFEKTYNVLDVRKTWTCGDRNPVNSNDNNSDQQQAKIFSLCIFENKHWNDSGSSSSNDEEFKEKIRTKGCPENSWVGCVTWSSAIICGWYTSQLLCLHRRHLGWELSSCHYSKILLNPSRAIHTNFLSHRVLTSPVTPIGHRRYISNDIEIKQINNDVDDSNDFEIKKAIYEVHQNINEEKLKKNKTTKKEVDLAVKDLLSVISGIEFELGIQNIKAGEYETAVSHLKLATTHHHASATFNLGVCYEQGLGVKKDLKMAVECYQEASLLGHAKSMYNLGVFYAQGLGGLQKNRIAAKACFNAASKLGQNHPDSITKQQTQNKKSSLLESAIKLQFVAVT